MNSILYMIVYTANILGIFNDPFEFEGDYGSEVNRVREKVFEQIVSKEAVSKNLTFSEVKQLLDNQNAADEEVLNFQTLLVIEGAEMDRKHGPVLSELITPSLLENLKEKQEMLEKEGFNSDDFAAIARFLQKYGHQKIFRFFRNNPPEFLGLDKALRDHASRSGTDFDLPLLSSTYPLAATNQTELKKNLMDALFTPEAFKLVKPEKALKEAVEKLNDTFLIDLLGEGAQKDDLYAFTTPAGQVFFYWAYQSLNLHLISEDPAMIEEINSVKETFLNSLGNSEARAQAFREKLIAADAGVVFTQESDMIVPQTLTAEGLFLPVDKQNPHDGTYVFLRSDLWEADYEIIEMEEYEGYKSGKISVILATRLGSGEKFLLASGHGNSTKLKTAACRLPSL